MTHPFRDQSLKTTRTANLIPFPASSGASFSESSLPDDVIDSILSAPALEEGLKRSVEGALTGLLLSQLENGTFQTDNPFNSIYLSKLQPDLIISGLVTELESLASIRDCSDTISFNDEWDD